MKHPKLFALFSLLAIFVLVLTGCTSSAGESSTSDSGGGFFSKLFGRGSATERVQDFRKGYEGVVFQFLENAPPKERYEGEYFSVEVGLQNKGAYDIERGFLELQDYSTTYISLSDEAKQEFSLQGKQALIPEGELNRISIAAQNTGIPKDSQGYPETFTATVCYPYSTLLVTDICVKTDGGNPSAAPDACKPQQQMTFDGQGSPVAITSLNYEVIYLDKEKAEIRFRTVLENKGKGVLVDFGSDCAKTAPLKLTEMNFLNYTLQGQVFPIKCVPENKTLDLRENKEMSCSIIVPRQLGRSAFVTPLRMRFDFGYTESKSTIVKIKKKI